MKLFSVQEPSSIGEDVQNAGRTKFNITLHLFRIGTVFLFSQDPFRIWSSDDEGTCSSWNEALIYNRKCWFDLFYQTVVCAQSHLKGTP